MNPPASHVPSAPPAYAFPERALRRWSRENLTLVPRGDGGFESVFNFEGSTCGNIAFTLLYHVAVAPVTAAHRIEAMRCEPAAFDAGHTRMCCWQEDSAAIAATTSRDTALLGQPLDRVLAWRPVRSPAGCLCTEPSRHHKWQAVLETLHFALNAPKSIPSP